MSLDCRNIHFSYPSSGGRNQAVLNGLTHSFKNSQNSLITGPTGSGKSTLLHLLAGLMRPRQGMIVSNGRPVSRWISAHLDLWRREVGLVFQEPQLLTDLTVMENVAAPLIPSGVNRREAHDKVMEILVRLDLAHLANQSAERLSGGERQRITLARALVDRPTYILADEPTAFQDDDHTSAILKVLAERRDQGACAVVCSHDNRLVRTGKFDAVLKLNHGRLEAL